jgi:hypothetical protein
MSRITLDSASEFLFGHRMHALFGDLPFPHNAHSTHTSSLTHASASATEFSEAFLEAQEIMIYRERFGWLWPLTEIWSDKATKSMEVVNATLAPIIKEAIRKKEAGKGVRGKEKREEGEGEGETLMDHLVEFTSGE